MANFNNSNSQWYQNLLENDLHQQASYGYPPYYPPPIQPRLINKYPQLGYVHYPQIPTDPYLNQFYPPQIPLHPLMHAHPAMISPRFFVDPTNPPKIKFDPKKIGSYQNSYLYQLKPPKPIEISINPIDDKTFTKTPMENMFSKEKDQLLKNKKFQTKKKRLEVIKNRQMDQPNQTRYLNDSKFNMLMEKQDAAMGKTPSVMSYQGSVQNSDLNAYSENKQAQDSRGNSSLRSVYTESSVNQASKSPQKINNKLNAEQQIQLNKNIILLNKQQIEGNTIGINDNNHILKQNNHQSGLSSESELIKKTKTTQRQQIAKNIRPLPEMLENKNLKSLNLLHLVGNRSDAHKKLAEKVLRDDFIRSNEWADVTKKKGSYESVQKKQEKMERVSKKIEYANMVKERNKERLRSLQSMSLNSLSDAGEAKINQLSVKSIEESGDSV